MLPALGGTYSLFGVRVAGKYGPNNLLMNLR